MNVLSLIFGIIAVVLFVLEGVRARRTVGPDGHGGAWAYSYLGWGLASLTLMLMFQYLWKLKTGSDLIYLNG